MKYVPNSNIVYTRYAIPIGIRFKALTDGRKHPNRWPCRLLVVSQSEARRFHKTLGATHVLSIKGTQTKDFGPRDMPDDRRLLMVFNDVPDASHSVPPTVDHIRRMQDWMLNLPEDAALMVHCLQGVHRSAATALGFLVQQTEPSHAMEILREIRAEADPNPLVVNLWDDFLGMNGRMVEAIS